MKDIQTSGGMWNLYKKGGLTPAIASMFDPRSAQHMAYIRSMMKEQRKQPLYEMELDQMEAVVFDLETTGFSPYNGDEILSIGATAMKGGEVIEGEAFYSLVNPKRKVPEEIEELTGITSGDAGKAPDLIHVLSRFLEFVDKRVLIAHGSGHDKHFLNSALWKTSRTSMTHRLLDTMMVAKWLQPKQPAYGLDELLRQYGVPVTRRHHALEDSRMTAGLWQAFLPKIKDRSVVTLGDLYAKLSLYQ